MSSRILRLRWVLLLALVAAVPCALYWSRIDPASSILSGGPAGGLETDRTQPADDAGATPTQGSEVAPDTGLGESAGHSLPDASQSTGADQGSSEVEDCGITIRVLLVTGEPAAEGVPLVARRLGWPRNRLLSCVTEDSSIGEFRPLSPGTWLVGTVSGAPLRIELPSGQLIPVDVVLDDSPPIQGMVVDQSELAVAGAEIWLARRSGEYAPTCAITDALGRFVVNFPENSRLIGARATGYSPSNVLRIDGIEGPIKLVLEAGAQSQGLILDIDGLPVPGAIVELDLARLTPRGSRRSGELLPAPLVSVSDSSGRVFFGGIPVGRIPVAIRADGFAPWLGTVETQAFASDPWTAHLNQGAVVAGVVAFSSGEPASGATVSTGKPGTLSWLGSTTSISGYYRLETVPYGTVQLRAVAETGSHEVIEDIHVSSSESDNVWNPVFPGLGEVSGVLIDPSGSLVSATVYLTHRDANGRWESSTQVDASGQFSIHTPRLGQHGIDVVVPGADTNPVVSMTVDVPCSPLRIELP